MALLVEAVAGFAALWTVVGGTYGGGVVVMATAAVAVAVAGTVLI